MRIDSITINNFKNVEKGELAFENARCPEGANVLALYGQNGSGKTALIDSLVVLRNLLWGESIPEKFGSFVTEGAEKTTIEYRFRRYDERSHKLYRIAYRVSFKANRTPTEFQLHPTRTFPDSIPFRCPLVSESLSYGYESDEGAKKRMHVVAAVDIDAGLSPGSFRDFLLDLQKNRRKETKPGQTTYVIQKSPNEEPHLERTEVTGADTPVFVFEIDYLEKLNLGCSFLFSSKVCDAISMFCDNLDLKFVHEAVRENAYKLGITGTEEAGLLEKNILPLYSLPFDENPAIACAQTEYGNRPIMVPMQIGPDPGEDAEIANRDMQKLKRLECGLNTILNAIIPGLSIDFRGREKYAGDPEPSVQVFASRNGKTIPLACESNGIKRIVSVVMLCVNAFNDPDFVAVIDEFDAGIFEYLLGEMLEVFQDEGCGQLIFTSHNLRALEKLDKGFVAFTTTDPANRYTRLKNVKTTNNLRDVYLKTLFLGGNDGELYNAESPVIIADAFMQAGQYGDYSVGQR